MNIPMQYIAPKSETEAAELYIMGDIVEEDLFTSDFSPADLLEQMKAGVSEDVNVHINSYGGATSAGMTIYNLLKNSGKKITTIAEGFVCSAASLIYMAGEKRVMRDSSLLMIHNAWTVATGNAEELRKQADDLQKISDTTAKIYEANTALTMDEVLSLMSAETWIDAEDALEMGFATEIDRAEKTEGQSYSSAFGSIRSALTKQENERKAMQEMIREAVREAVCSLIPAPAEEKAPAEPEEAPEQPAQEEVKTPFQRFFGNFK